MMGGFTHASLMQTADKMMRDMELSAAGKVAEILSTAPSTEVFPETKPTGKPVEIAEDLIDILTMHINQAVGTSLPDFVILLPVSLVAVLERAAQRAGKADLQELIGASVQATAVLTKVCSCCLNTSPRLATARTVKATFGKSRRPVTLAVKVGTLSTLQP